MMNLIEFEGFLVMVTLGDVLKAIIESLVSEILHQLSGS